MVDPIDPFEVGQLDGFEWSQCRTPLTTRCRRVGQADRGKVLLAPTAVAAMEALGVDTIAVVADRDYFKIEGIKTCERAELDVYPPRSRRSPCLPSSSRYAKR